MRQWRGQRGLQQVRNSIDSRLFEEAELHVELICGGITNSRNSYPSELDNGHTSPHMWSDQSTCGVQGHINRRHDIASPKKVATRAAQSPTKQRARKYYLNTFGGRERGKNELNEKKHDWYSYLIQKVSHRQWVNANFEHCVVWMSLKVSFQHHGVKDHSLLFTPNCRFPTQGWPIQGQKNEIK